MARRLANDPVQFDSRLTFASKRKQRATERQLSGWERVMTGQPITAESHGVFEPAETPIVFRELREGDRRRVTRDQVFECSNP
jgi:uridine phosphorylase